MSYTGHLIKQRYQVCECIGQGSSGEVYSCADFKTSTTVAIKIVLRSFLEDETSRVRFSEELRIQKMLNHPNIMPILDILYEEDYIGIVMPYCKYGDLFNLISKNACYDVKHFLYQIASAIQYMHFKNLAHLDLKPENIMVNDKYDIMLSDFGSAQDLSLSLIPHATTLYYTAPELLGELEAKDLRQADIWSLGILTFAMCTGKLPFTSTNEKALIEEIKMGKVVQSRFIPLEVSNLIKVMLVKEPSERITSSELIQDRFFNFFKREKPQIKCRSYSSNKFNSSSTQLIVKPRPVNSKPFSRTPMNQY